ncbi:uncharacterized protein UMAG_05217 [Mycosarcoma maydis]|uniref:Vacuolar sorting protein Vps3844 C-terminal domain-containing protein n=1 Tax=Mycosarcoma maydis TaxID=5270 RepID=A0A0D1E6W2_MYCMD|nr:uncharacterized protein UMAG_05217 [Ustilago maydis 521]KIS70145.1 hypothetical protein UMAG_05217 [Ustilago maydis 521]|eukprot:XP_011388256.1 hypothetical protein UMAG_05217 [Ustilago maydis 521]
MVRIAGASLASLALTAATVAVTGASAKTSLYLSPAHNLAAAPISVNADEAHRILSHHIDIGDASELDDSATWAHVLRSNKHGDVQIDQRTMVERLFDGHQDEQNRLLVLMHGSAYEDVIPNGVHATHSIDSAPSSSSFDALFDSYMSSASRALKASESTLSHLTGSFLDGFSASLEWLTSKSDKVTATWSQQVASFKSSTFDKLEDELRSAEALLAKLKTSKPESATQDLTLQPLRFSGLRNVEITYGTDSAEYLKAKELVRAAVEQVTSLFQTRSEEQGRAASIAFVVTDTVDSDASRLLVKRSSDVLHPFLERPSELSYDAAVRQDAFVSEKPSSRPSPLPKNLAGTCFTSQSSLETATNNCSGHGKAVKTNKGGKPCYRCQCKPTEQRKGKKTYWAGAACEKKDVSTEFVLLASSVLLLGLIALGSVYFLYAQGSSDLPGTLASVTINLK